MNSYPTHARFAVNLVVSFVGALLLGGQGMAAQPGTEMHIEETKAPYLEYGVSAAVRAGDFLYIGGIVAMDSTGASMTPYDGKAQAEIVYSRIQQLLQAHGATARNVVSETIYLTDWQRYFDGAGVRKRFYDEAKAAYPSNAAVEVVSLATAGLVLEVEIVAYLGEN